MNVVYSVPDTSVRLERRTGLIMNIDLVKHSGPIRCLTIRLIIHKYLLRVPFRTCYELGLRYFGLGHSQTPLPHAVTGSDQLRD